MVIMEKKILAGVVGCDMTEEFFQTSLRNTIENFYWKKIYSGKRDVSNSYKDYPTAEIVSDIKTIVNDNDISLVFVSADHLEFVPQVMQAGKSVRVV